jgi:hypothetical protein
VQNEGPPLEVLTRRLSECPAEFLAEPRIGTVGSIHVSAVVFDLIRDLGGSPVTAAQAALFEPKDAKKTRNWLSLVLITSHLLHDPWFRARVTFSGEAISFLATELVELAQVVQSPRFVSDPDRREELARLTLNALGLRPAGESIAQAQDRLTTISTLERQHVIRAARAAEERMRQIREAMAKKAAEEAADKWIRE